MATGDQLHVRSLHRYPVKSMLGETVTTLNIGAGGAEGDRLLALIDDETGLVASAKQARRWRLLLKCTARIDGDQVRVRLPDGTEVSPGQDVFGDALSALVSRPVRVATHRPAGASLERADPEQVLDRGLDAVVDAPLLELGEATPAVHALRTPATENLFDSFGLGRLPCAGAYFDVVTDGTISLDDPFSMV